MLILLVASEGGKSKFECVCLTSRFVVVKNCEAIDVTVRFSSVIVKQLEKRCGGTGDGLIKFLRNLWSPITCDSNGFGYRMTSDKYANLKTHVTQIGVLWFCKRSAKALLSPK